MKLLSVLFAALFSLHAVADGRITNADISSTAAIAHSKMANVATLTIMGNSTGGSGPVTALSVATVSGMLGVPATAFGLAFTPTTPAEWAVVPANVGAALDQLSGRAVALPLTTKGDILTRDATSLIRFPVCANDEAMIADSSQASGWRCGTADLSAKWDKAGDAGTGGTGVIGTTDAQPFNLRANGTNVVTVLSSHAGLSASPTIIPADATGVNQFDWRTYASPTVSTTGASHTNTYSALIWDNPNAGFNNSSGSLISSNSSFSHNGTGTINYASTNTNSAGFNSTGVTTQFKGVTSENQISSGATVTDYYGMASGLSTTGGILGSHTGISQYSNFTDTTFAAQSNGITNSDLYAGTTTLGQGVTGYNSYIQFDDTTTITNQVQGFSSGITMNDDVVANGIAAANVNVQINDNAAAGGINLNSISLAQSGASTSTGVNGYNANVQFSGTSSTTAANLVNLYARTSDTADLDRFTAINSNPELEGSSTIDNVTGISITPQIRGSAVTQNITGGSISPQMSGTASADNFTGLSVQPAVNGTSTLTNSLTGLYVQPQSTVALNGVTGANIDMSGVVLDSAYLAAGGQKKGLSINDGQLEAGYGYTVPGASGFFQNHYIGGTANVASGDPTAAFGFGTNLAQTVTLHDDWALDGSGLGFVNVGFVGALNFDTGTTLDRWTGALGGAGNPGGAGTLTDAIMFRAAGVLPQGGTLTVTNAYGFQVDPNLFGLTGTNQWGFFENTATAENHMSKLAIGTGTFKVANSDTALEIGNNKAFLNGRGTTAQKNALTAAAGMQFYDTTLNELQWYNGASWVAASGSGSVTSVSVATANGFAGSSSGGATPSLTLTTSVTGIVKGNGTALSAAVSGTDYQAPISTDAAVANQFLTGFTAPNTFTRAQPAFSDLSGNATVAQGGTGLTTLTPYAIMAGGTTGTGNQQQVSGLGTSGQVLTSNGAAALPTWQAAGTASPLTTKGDVYTFDTVNQRLAVGTNGQVLTADSAEATGLKWATPSSGSGGGMMAFTLDGAIVPFTSINGTRSVTATNTLSSVYLSLLNSGSSGATQVQVNQYRSGSLVASATASLNASSSLPASGNQSLSGALSLLSGDVLSVDVVSAAPGASDLAVEVSLATASVISPSSSVANARFTLDDAVVPYTTVNGSLRIEGAQVLSTISMAMLDAGSSGSTQVRLNQWRGGVLFSTATASLASNAGGSNAATATLSGSLTLAANDILSLDVVSVAAGTPQDLSVSFPMAASTISSTIQVSTQTGNYTATNTDDVIVMNCSSACTLTMQSAAAATLKSYKIKRTGAGEVTISRAGADTIDGDTSMVLGTQYSAIELIPTGGTSWSVF